jgi:hypothetical protein
LLAAWDNTSVIENTLTGAGVSEWEFIRALQSVAAGNWGDYPRLRDAAISISPYFPPLRGPKISAASAAHQTILEDVGGHIKVGAYTWNDVEGRCTDPLTEATRREFDYPVFDPRPAVRRSKSNQKKISN